MRQDPSPPEPGSGRPPEPGSGRPPEPGSGRPPEPGSGRPPEPGSGRPPERGGPTPPDYRFSLANERTFLAWLRTALALVGGGLAVAQFLGAGVVRTVLAVALLGLGALVAVWSVAHWARTERA